MNTDVRALTAEEIELISGGYETDRSQRDWWEQWEVEHYEPDAHIYDPNYEFYMENPGAPTPPGEMDVDWGGVALDLSLITAGSVGGFSGSSLVVTVLETAKELRN